MCYTLVSLELSYVLGKKVRLIMKSNQCGKHQVASTRSFFRCLNRFTKSFALLDLSISHFIAAFEQTPVKLISITPPKQEDYQDFERDIPSGDLNQDINEPKDDQNPEMVLELKGEEDDEPRDYNEPEFPPRHPPCEAEPKGAEIQCRSTIEERATEW